MLKHSFDKDIFRWIVVFYLQRRYFEMEVILYTIVLIFAISGFNEFHAEWVVLWVVKCVKFSLLEAGNEWNLWIYLKIETDLQRRNCSESLPCYFLTISWHFIEIDRILHGRNCYKSLVSVKIQQIQHF